MLALLSSDPRRTVAADAADVTARLNEMRERHDRALRDADRALREAVDLAEDVVAERGGRQH